jgi:hypothetical protein
MKQLVIGLAAVVILVVAWAAGSRDAVARRSVSAQLRAPAAAAPGVGFGTCAPGSQGTCTGQIFGTQCGTNPTRSCLPLSPAPGGGEICSCR